MTTLQKVIKYLALAFAIFIIVNIISGILFGIYSLSGILGLAKNNETTIENYEEITTNFENSNIQTLKIELEYSSLVIKKGNTLMAQSNNANVSYKQNNNQLIVKENSSWFSKNNKRIVILYIPEDIILDRVNIETGAGKIEIEELNTRELSFKIGAGEVEIQNLNVQQKAKIDGGAGKVSILAGKINDLDLNMGIGKFELTSILTGKNDIDAGVGKLNLNLLDNIENYAIKVDKGIGTITINGKETQDSIQYGNGDTLIDIDGGVGSIEIKSK